MNSHASEAENRVRLLDGGTGSELRRRGIALSEVCWSAAANLEHVELLTEIHRDYLSAGSDIITANTFATSRFVLAAAGLAEQFTTINANAILAAKRAAADADRNVTVAASLSCMPPGFDSSAYPPPDTEYRAYCELAECFAAHGVDLVLLEMLQDDTHTARACRAVRAQGLPFWAGISCQRAPGVNLNQRNQLVSFDNPELPFEPVLETVLRFEPAGIAIMHSPVDALAPALETVRQQWSGPIGAYPEIPYAEDPAAVDVVPVSSESFAAAARDCLALDVTLIGGCCGTTGRHIAALRALLDG
jgi:S-methylmethionine-dependent homocysteine/selenocysteine methylase